MNRKFITLPASLLMTISLAACASGTAKVEPIGNSMKPTLESTAIDKAMENALAQAEASGNDQEILAMLGQVHERNPSDPIVATRYARSLREDDQINTAIRTLDPFVKSDSQNVEAITEMAMAQLALGDFETAEEYAMQATKIDDKSARAFLALGTAQDAQRKHQDAEVSFRSGLKYWQGDPTPILNNLALNLASQGHLQEALSLLEKAKKLAPNRIELERNRRIIATLLETAGPRAPAPGTKPTSSKPDTTKTDASSTDVPSAADLNAKNVKPSKPAPQPEPKEEASKEKEVDVKTEEKPQAKKKKTKTNIKFKPLND